MLGSCGRVAISVRLGSRSSAWPPSLSSSPRRGRAPTTPRSATASLACARRTRAWPRNSQHALLELYSLQTPPCPGRAEDRRPRGAERRGGGAARVGAKRARRRAHELPGGAGQLATRLRQLYIEGDVDPLAVLLGAESLDEIVSALDGLNRLADAGQGHHRPARARQGRAPNGLSAPRRRARPSCKGLLADARATRASLAAARDARAAYLASLRRQQQLNRYADPEALRPGAPTALAINPRRATTRRDGRRRRLLLLTARR